MSSTLNVFQQVFSLSMASNEVKDCNDHIPELQRKLKLQIDKDLKKTKEFGSGWEVVWGPVVWRNSDILVGHPDNAWYIAKNDSVLFEDGNYYPAYVVAIAATSSLFGWFGEDFVISKAVDLDSWLDSGGITSKPVPVPHDDIPTNHAAISEGFSIGTFQLMNNAPPNGSPGASVTLPNFLKSLPHSPASKLVFTGHSLGGALSPALALLLLKAGFLSPFAQDNINVYPTAGPTPGNLQFAKDFSASFPAKPDVDLEGYHHWNCNIVNLLDVVPHGYCQDPSATPEVLQNISTIYGNPTKQLYYLEYAISILQSRARNFYFPIAKSRFFLDSVKPEKPPKNSAAFLKEAHEQHVNAYGFKIHGKRVPRSLCEKQIKTETDMEEDWMSHPVLGDLAKEAKKKKAEEREKIEGGNPESEDQESERLE